MKKKINRKARCTYNIHFVLNEEDINLLNETIVSGGFVSGGDGKGGKNRLTITQFFRYCLHHINDNKEINLTPENRELAEAMIDAIAKNRKPIEEGLEDVRALRDEFKPVAVNINQIACRINLLKMLFDKGEISLEKCAGKMELAADCLHDILEGYDDEDGHHAGLVEYIARADEILKPVRTRMAGVLDREDKILERLII